MRERYGSKAAYEAARGPIRDANREFARRHYMTEDERKAEDAERNKRRNLEHLDGDQAMMTWTLFAAAAQAGGHAPLNAAKHADAMIAEAKRRFT